MSESEDKEIVLTAQAQFKRCEEFESVFRSLFVEDIRFCNADSDNKYQWPDALYRARALDKRPSLTINKTRQHVLMIQNEILQDMPAVKVSPTGGDASYDSSQVYAGVVRAIEYNSNASDAYKTAMNFQVQGGLGYWRVVTDYQGIDSFDQEIFIRRIKDPLSVYLDVDCVESDGSDAKYGFIFNDMDKDEFNRKYPRFREKIGNRSVFNKGNSWHNKDCIRVAEYFYCEYSTDWLFALPIRDDQQQPIPGQFDTMRLSEVPKELHAAIRDDETIQRRKIEVKTWKWCMIAGDEIIDRKVWPGIYIPIVRVVGEEMIIEGKLDRKGHVRNLKDPQRMYNYWTSSAVEQVALQGKQPYVAAVQAIKGYEQYYSTANRENYSYLPYNGVDEQGNAIAAPQREVPPQMAPAYINGMQIAAEEMKMVSGQSDPTMGMQSNELAGVAIKRRIKQGDKATFHYIDNMAKAIRYTGKILIDLIPKIYDTPRVIRILAEDGTDEQIQIDPTQQQALTTQSEDKGEAEASRIFNPSVGKYDVIAQAGPSYATKREEAAEAMTAIALQSPTFLDKAGDLFFKTQDFPGAEALAERYRNSIPANLLGDGPTPEMQQLQQQLQDSQAQLAATMQALADEQKGNDDKAKANEINAYKAVTERLSDMLTRMEKLGPVPVIDLVTAQTSAIAMESPEPMNHEQASMPTNSEQFP